MGLLLPALLVLIFLMSTGLAIGVLFWLCDWLTGRRGDA